MEKSLIKDIFQIHFPNWAPLNKRRDRLRQQNSTWGKKVLFLSFPSDPVTMRSICSIWLGLPSPSASAACNLWFLSMAHARLRQLWNISRIGATIRLPLISISQSSRPPRSSESVSARLLAATLLRLMDRAKQSFTSTYSASLALYCHCNWILRLWF